jgi:hypothetical protein
MRKASYKLKLLRKFGLPAVVPGLMARRFGRKRPYLGMTAAVLAVGGVAAAVARNERIRGLTGRVFRRLTQPTASKTRLATPADPY